MAYDDLIAVLLLCDISTVNIAPKSCFNPGTVLVILPGDGVGQDFYHYVYFK